MKVYLIGASFDVKILDEKEYYSNKNFLKYNEISKKIATMTVKMLFFLVMYSQYEYFLYLCSSRLIPIFYQINKFLILLAF